MVVKGGEGVSLIFPNVSLRFPNLPQTESVPASPGTPPPLGSTPGTLKNRGFRGDEDGGSIRRGSGGKTLEFGHLHCVKISFLSCLYTCLNNVVGCV